MTEQSAHSELPPSSSDKWTKCHAWLRLNRGIESTSSAAAEEGTLAHEILADHLLGGERLNNCDDDEMFDHLYACADWVEKQKGVMHVETRVDFGEPYGFVDLTGTADLIFVDKDMITIADLKYGRGVVEVEHNTQLMCYLVGAVHQYGPRKKYRLAILQPRAWHQKGPYREHVLGSAEFEQFKARLFLAIRGNYSHNSEASAGDHCRHYCNALGRCKAAAQKSLDFLRNAPKDM